MTLETVPWQTPYDKVPYPTAIFSQATPDRLATMARLHGLDAPHIANPRVLEIGGGDGMNLLALAAAWPGLEGLSFDLAASAIARGQAWAAGAQLGNVRLEQLDILDAAEGAIQGPWDYVIAHGVYAWTPPSVRKATMRLIGKVLSPRGVAFVSFNAHPGGHLRLAMREMLFHHLQDVHGEADRAACAKQFLKTFAEQEETQEPLATAMRKLAAAMATRPDGVLYHDELGEFYEPQLFTDVVSAAATEGLLWLSDAGVGRLLDGFGTKEQDQLVRTVQSGDFLEGRFFRQSLFIRAPAEPLRSLSPDAVAPLYAACRGSRTGESTYTVGGAVFEIKDNKLVDLLDRLIASWPARIPCGDLGASAEHLKALVGLFDAGLVELHSAAQPFALEPGDTPAASPLARLQLALGWPAVSTLDHQTLAIADPAARELVQLLNGSRDMSTLLAEWAVREVSRTLSLHDALSAIARSALLLKPGAA